MDPFKIKVTHELNNIKIQEALFELGCEWFGSTNEVKPLANCWIDVGSNGRLAWSFHGSDEKEITPSQLRDLVVLKRNDVKDATHTDGERKAFRDSDGKYHYWCFDKNEWFDAKHIAYLVQYLMPINQDPALISGADIPSLIKKGESIQFRSVFNVQGGGEWKDLNLERDEEEFSLGDLINTRFEWRLKPQTIKLGLELPKPFEPEVGQEVWFISDDHGCGYSRYEHGEHSTYVFGCWATEDEIKQVVEQLRKIRGAS